MPALQAASGGGESFGSAGTGAGTDVLAEVERIRWNLAALAEVVEGIRGKLNGHTHGGVVGAPAAGEQAVVPFTLQ